MDSRLAALDDATASYLLTHIAAAHFDETSLPADLTPEIRAALAHTFGTSSTPATEGDLARDVLCFLTRAPETRPIVTALLDGPEPQRYATRSASTNAKLGTTISITIAALIALQTHLKLERHPDGRWTARIEKQAIGSEVLAPIVQKILGVPALPKKP